MSKAAKELYDKLKDLGNKGIDRCTMAVVKSVDKENNSCTVLLDDLEIGGVRLKATMNGNAGFKIYPAENSNVLIERISDDGYFFVSMVSEVESVEVTIGDKKYLLNADGHLIGNADNTLLSVLNLIIDAVMATIVFQGRSPDYEKLQEAKTMASQILQ